MTRKANSALMRKSASTGSISKQKPKRTKSRNGCITCKRKRLKCGEEKPFCLNCLRKNIPCGGYAKSFRWKDFSQEEMKQSDGKATGDTWEMENSRVGKENGGSSKQLIVTGSSTFQEALEAATVSVTGKTVREISIANGTVAGASNRAAVEVVETEVRSSEAKVLETEVEVIPESGKEFPLSSATSTSVNIISSSSIPSPLSDGFLTAQDQFLGRISPVLAVQPSNALQEILNSSRSPLTGQFDSPKFFSLLTGNHTAVEQFQTLMNSPNIYPDLSQNPPSPMPLLSARRSSPGTPLAASPGFSSLISAFASLDEAGRPVQSSSQTPLIESSSVASSPGVSSSHSLGFSPSALDSDIISIPRSLPSPSPERLRLLSAFDRYTCGIMSIKNGPTENPWRTFMLPLSHEFPVMFNALSAMTCFHVARNDSALRSKGAVYMKSAIMDLVEGLSRKTTPPDVALATCLALAMGEAWDRQTSTGIGHLKGARTMVLQVLNNIQRGEQRNNYVCGTSADGTDELSQVSDGTPAETSPVTSADAGLSRASSISNLISPRETRRSGTFSPHTSPSQVLTGLEAARKGTSTSATSSGFAISPVSTRGSGSKVLYPAAPPSLRRIPRNLQFLFNTWVYFDVLARMTSDGDTDSDSEDGLSSPAPSDSIISKFLSFDLSAGDNVDPLLGVGQSLFPVIGEVATLISGIRHVKKKRRNSLGDISRGVELKRRLESWTAPVVKDWRPPQDPLFDTPSAIATTEAYRYSALLYLHQAVPEIPSLSSHMLAENILLLLASIPTSSRTCVTHIFPLLVASCEAQPGEERQWATHKWDMLSNKMWIGNVDRAREVVREVWARKDRTAQEGTTDPGTVNKGEALNSTLAKDPTSELQSGSADQEFSRLSLRISECINGPREGNARDDDIWSWSHWSTVMRDWGWEVLLA
ncbi:DEKNAAC104768 [Brettanomyces naardenensis]|uniref:DEKNAAC104768 n=1 Tax=Brettanomyces naardenensis TaxID=13370 RepID=A0A448YRR6_BRENA|nr:DEKNAAC104768 [Brettanomyces naardenensis]